MVELSRKGDGEANAAPEVEAGIEQARGGGQPLDRTVQRQMESAFGTNFSHVRVHTDSGADTLNHALSARAFTTGQDIFFRQGEYNPGSSAGRQLLAHELTHVVQQNGFGVQRKTITRPLANALTSTELVSASRASTHVQRVCQECSDELTTNRVSGTTIQPKLTVSQPNDPYEQEADQMAQVVMRLEEEPSIQRQTSVSSPIANRVGGNASGLLIQRVPAPGSNFGTYRHCGFGITTRIPGFIQSHFTGDFDVDYTSGCAYVGWNAWTSVWELYDSSDTKQDTNTEAPLGGYTIESSKIRAGTPGEDSSKWSLWYRVERSNIPWDSDAYPYHYVEFDVYSLPIRNPNTQLRQETGPVVWQDNFTPAEDDASFEYNLSTTATRDQSSSQTTTASTTVSGERSTSFGFAFDGLTGDFASRLGFEATASVSRTHSISLQTSQTTSKRFTQPNLRGGVTYSIIARPLYHIIDGSVDLISHRDGVISGNSRTLTGAIRALKGVDITIESGGSATATARGRWSCDASCNVEGTESQCTGRVTGSSSGHPDEKTACREAKRDATQKAPRDCYARHCQCKNCTNR